MEYLHVKNLEKYHPGYKDRTLQWAKIYFTMVQGDPNFELIFSEVDKWRAVTLICLELTAKKPLPICESYYKRKGFNCRSRSLAKTIETLVLHNFLEIVTVDEISRYSDKDKEKDKESRVSPKHFDFLWSKYPKKLGRKKALTHYIASVRNDEDRSRIETAIGNFISYHKNKKTDEQYIQHGSTWFNNWEDWVNKDIKSTNQIRMA